MECSATQWSAQGQPWKNTGLLQSSALSSRLCENTKQAHRGELFGFAAPRNLGQMSVERHEIAPASGPLAFSHTLSSQPDEQVHPSEGEANQWVFSGASEANSKLKLRRHKHLKICLSHPLVPATLWSCPCQIRTAFCMMWSSSTAYAERGTRQARTEPSTFIGQ